MTSNNIAHYGTAHSLQTVQYTTPNISSPAPGKFYIAYIHGGAWRSPAQSAADINKAQELLLGSKDYSDVLPSIAGFASINYGLSPSPARPSDDPSRNYRHPQHVNDVRLAMDYLSRAVGVGRKDGFEYVLVGHSCGATMAFQLASMLATANSGVVKPPAAIVGVEGLYDLPLLVKNHPDPIYREFITEAFGQEEEKWAAASPVNDGKLRDVLERARVVTLAHSDGDELVEWEQVDVMKAAIERAGAQHNKLQVGKLAGNHDDVWEKGWGVANAIAQTLKSLSVG